MIREPELREKYLRVFEQSHDDVRDAMGRMQQLLEVAERAPWGSVWRLVIQARMDRTMRRFEKALRLVRRALEKKPRNPYALLLQGAILSDKRRTRDAIDSYSKVVSLYRNRKSGHLQERVAKALLCRALAYVNEHLYKEALDDTKALLSGFKGTEHKLIPEYRKGAAWVKYRAMLGMGKNHQQARRGTLASVHGYLSQLETHLEMIRVRFDESEKGKFFASVERGQTRTEDFLSAVSGFRARQALLFVLREWNSFTPAVPDETACNRGGGYFIKYRDKGIVIDPGYDFLKNYYEAGGRIHDISHVIVTHAHDDHTAELESLLMLVYRYNRDRARAESDMSKRIRLYLNQSAERKFSGILPLRDCPYVDRVVTLSRPDVHEPQRISLCKGARLTVLPAYHDDQITRDTAVGLGLELVVSRNRTRRIVFTGDTGLYPSAPRAGSGNELVVSNKAEEALHMVYPPEFKKRRLDLLVAHIGSIRRSELEPLSLDEVTGRRHRRFYPNHLGLLGTLILLDQLRPKAAVISEFGEELRDIRISLVQKLGEALRHRQARSSKPQLVVLPGDLGMVYDIAEGKFLCHEDCSFRTPSDLEPRPIEARTASPARLHAPERVHLLLKRRIRNRADAALVEPYYVSREKRTLAYLTRQGRVQG